MRSQKSDSTVTYLHEDYAALEYILLGDLRDLLDEPITDETTRWLKAVLDVLLETLPRATDLEDNRDCLDEVLQRFPSWYPQVDRMRKGHRMLFTNLRKLRNRIACQKPVEDVAQELQRELHEWLTSLVAHHRHENRLLLTAMNLEVGAGD